MTVDEEMGRIQYIPPITIGDFTELNFFLPRLWITKFGAGIISDANKKKPSTFALGFLKFVASGNCRSDLGGSSTTFTSVNTARQLYDFCASQRKEFVQSCSRRAPQWSIYEYQENTSADSG